jgi:hypothetical protein
MLEFTKTQSKNAGRRSIKTSYTITGSEQTDKFGHVSVAVLEVSTSHHADQKMFFSTVNRNRTHNDGMFTVGSYDLMEKAPIKSGVQQTARYSVKALEATHTAYVADIAASFETALVWASEKVVAD